MGKTVILQIDELAQGMVQAFQVVNDAFNDVEEAHNKPFAVDATAGDYALATLDMLRYQTFNVSNHTAAITFTVEEEVDTIIPVATNRIITVRNLEGFDITVTTDNPGTTVVVPALSVSRIQVEGPNCYSLTNSVLTDQDLDLDLTAANATLSVAQLADNSVLRATMKVTANLEFIDNTLTGDTVTIDDGINAPVVITWDTEVTVGGSFDVSAANLVTYIATLFPGTLNVVAEYSTPNMTLTNHNITEAALADSAASVSDASITATDFALPSATRTITVPEEADTSGAPSARVLDVVNEANILLTVTTDNPGTTQKVGPHSSRRLYVDGPDVVAAGSDPAYVVNASRTGGPLGATEEFYREIFHEEVEFHHNFAGSVLDTGTNPTGTTVLDIKIDGSDVGDISISTGGVPTFTIDSNPLVVSPGEILTIVGPGSADASAGNISIALTGRRN